MKEKNLAAQMLGRLGGAARQKALTPARRSAIAKKAATAKWKKWRQQQKKDIAIP